MNQGLARTERRCLRVIQRSQRDTLHALENVIALIVGEEQGYKFGQYKQWEAYFLRHLLGHTTFEEEQAFSEKSQDRCVEQNGVSVLLVSRWTCLEHNQKMATCTCAPSTWVPRWLGWWSVDLKLRRVCFQVAPDENGQEIHITSSPWKPTHKRDVFKWSCSDSSCFWFLWIWSEPILIVLLLWWTDINFFGKFDIAMKCIPKHIFLPICFGVFFQSVCCDVWKGHGSADICV